MHLSCMTQQSHQIYGPDPNLDRIEKCGPYLLCIRPPSPLVDAYIIRLYHKDSKEVVIAVDPPVKVYRSINPNYYYRPLFGKCWWWVYDNLPFLIMYNGQLVCRWGGEDVVKQLPYEHGQQSLMWGCIKIFGTTRCCLFRLQYSI